MSMLGFREKTLLAWDACPYGRESVRGKRKVVDEERRLENKREGNDQKHTISYGCAAELQASSSFEEIVSG